MNNYKAQLISILAIPFIFFSCDQTRVYDYSISIPDQKWHMDSLIYFEVPITDTVSLHNFYFNIRHNTDYPYSNIYLFISTQFPNKQISRDTIELILADKKGKWIGKGIGKIKDNQVLLRKNLRFPRKGNYTFGIEQAMRSIELKGIEDIGIRIEKSK